MATVSERNLVINAAADRAGGRALGMNIDGMAEVQRMLKTISPRITKKNLRRAVNQGAAIVGKEARRRAPKREGRLRRNIKWKRRKGKSTYAKSSVYVQVGERTQQHELSTGHFMPGSGSFKDDPKDAFYWRFIERGTKYIVARPFIRPAVSSKFRVVVNHVRDELTRGVRTEVRRAMR